MHVQRHGEHPLPPPPLVHEWWVFRGGDRQLAVSFLANATVNPPCSPRSMVGFFGGGIGDLQCHSWETRHGEHPLSPFSCYLKIRKIAHTIPSVDKKDFNENKKIDTHLFLKKKVFLVFKNSRKQIYRIPIVDQKVNCFK